MAPVAADTLLRALLKPLCKLEQIWSDPGPGLPRARVLVGERLTPIQENGRHALKIIEAFLVPCPGPVLAREISGLRMATKMRESDPADLTAQVRLYVADLAHYPADVVVASCRRLRRSVTFFPTLSEIIAEIEPMMVDRRAALASWTSAAG